ncbi:ATP-binding protein [Halalkalibaculum sp. DA3122]
MNIKTKLYAGLGILAFLIIILGGSGLIFINTLADNSSAIIRNNIRTLTYMENMEQTLKELHLKQASQLDSSRNITQSSAVAVDSLKKQLANSLSAQQQNITETGEADLSNQLQGAIKRYLDRYKQLNSANALNLSSYQEMARQYGQIQGMLAEITNLNIEAIERKNDAAQRTASNVIFYMTIIGGVSALLAFGLLIKYPNYIVKPIRELIDRIKQIADQNYDQRLEFTTGDEYEELAQAFNRMANRLQEYDSSTMAKLMNEKQRIEAIINHMHEAIIGLDREKNVLFVNAKAEELIGSERSSLVGRYAPDIASTNDLVRKLIQDLMEANSRKEVESDEPDLIKIKNGERQVYYSKEIIPVITGNAAAEEEKQIGTIITLKNVTHFQEMDEAKSNFVAVVSHELKTPIASINMSLRLLEDERVGTLNEEQSNLIQSIRDDTRRMKRTTTELLDLSKIEAGNIQLNTQPAQPLDLIEYAYETMMMQANQKDIELEIHCDQNLPPVKTDVQKTVWVLVNLISNAIRYTPKNGLIELKAEEKPSSIKFLVTDTGEGIAEEYLGKIFQKYFQIHAEKDGDGGSGLGLAIAKEFINAQGGEIDVQSTVGKGSTFYFTLPKN